jgi:hypothetical protein
MSDSYQRLIDQVEQDPPKAWIPTDEEPLLVGTFVRLDRGTTAYGPTFIAVLRSEDDVEHAVWLIHAVLRNELKRLRPQPGELVAIRYLGKRRSANGHPYASYRVAVDRESSPIDWAALQDNEGDPSGWDALNDPANAAAVVATALQSNDIPF